MNFRPKFVWTGAGILLVALAQSGSIVWAQSPVLSASAVAAPNAGAAVDAATDPNAVRLLVGRSTVLDVGTPIARVSLTSAEVADALEMPVGTVKVRLHRLRARLADRLEAGP